jgi:cytochrome c biogenesis protein CcmG/thiol:disulfide interchange protein DsbE
MNLNRIFKSLFLIIVFLSFTQLFAQRKIENQTSSNKAPDFTLEDLNGKKVKLSDFKGKVVIINFWATWCPPCKAEIPDFIELYKTYQKKGLVILGIALDNKEKVVKFVKDNGINYPVLMGNQEVSNLYGGISGIPTSFVVDRKGIIKNVFVGLRSKEVFEQNIKDNL